MSGRRLACGWSLALDQAPFLTGTARLEDVGNGQRLYVVDLETPGPGKYFLQAEPVGRDGRIEAKCEGGVSVRDLEAAVRRFLT